MIEPEIAFADINDLMDIEEDFLKYIVKFVSIIICQFTNIINNNDDNYSKKNCWFHHYAL